MSRSNSLIPKSKAKTAYGLLSEIVALVKAEPRRMRMASYRAVLNFMPAESVPPCGTVGCVAGWVAALKKPRADTDNAGRIGQKILGLNDWQAHSLFYGDLCSDVEQGTPRHASRVIQMIRDFQKQYASQLKAKRV